MKTIVDKYQYISIKRTVNFWYCKNIGFEFENLKITNVFYLKTAINNSAVA